MKGTTFGKIHSGRDLHLIAQSIDIQPAEPKLNLVSVPGADGSKDLSEQPAGRITYESRKITWVFALYPGDDWVKKRSAVCNAINGLACDITLDEDPGWYYRGRVTVSKYHIDGMLKQITVEATCHPWKFKKKETVVTTDLSTVAVNLRLMNSRKPVVPIIEATTKTDLSFLGKHFSVTEGSHVIADIELKEGENILEASAADGGKITVRYREGEL